MEFQIEQVALAPRDPEAARELLKALGATEMVIDHVQATGEVFGQRADNAAELSFDYQLLKGGELEILAYEGGPNWLDLRNDADPHRASHLGMHCTEDELKRWKRFFNSRGIGIAQEVHTLTHTNPHIAGKRWYHYCIFNTYPILGIDLKLIVRIDARADI